MTGRDPSSPRPPPAVSVVVPTFQRAGRLPALVAALEAQANAPIFEVVVVDNGSTDETPARLADLAARTSLDLRVVRVPTNRGPARARNLGVRSARAPVLAFTDDDCLPLPGWLAAGVAALEGGATLVVGRVRPPDDADPGPFDRRLVVADDRFFQTANLFARREDVLAVGGFDETFRDAAGEDTDLALRVLAHTGGRSAFVDGAVVEHPVQRGDWRTAVRTATRWADLALVVARHPQVRTLLHRRVFWKDTHPATVLALGALAGAAWWRPALLGMLPWVDLRLRRRPRTPDLATRWRTLPQVFLVDATEVATMVRGSVRHRTLLL